ncbi:hypothetical protein AMTRI_Chr05g57380 [Amborella trichopoda]|uniref:Glycosyltransferases n=1 Tax=Amborella trichopoda TaxID=13333 RepID=W1NSM4_AMBTC|nr:hypothetical protein AMTR_s00109p00122730 [Amborella trichopoda]
MTSFRRTMSVVQRDGPAQNGESFSISSPSHRFSPMQNYSPPYFSATNFLLVLSRFGSLFLGVFSHKSSRTTERSKTRSQVWKRAYIHFVLCFMVGLFAGFTPFSLMDDSPNLVSKNQAFSFDMNPQPVNMHTNVLKADDTVSLVENKEPKKNIIVELAIKGDSSIDASLPLSYKNRASLVELSPIESFNLSHRKLLIIVTPTYNRAFQAYYLNRLAYTLKLVPPPLLWIVVEIPVQSMETAEILRKTGVMYRHLVCEKNFTSSKLRGVNQRNVALAHIEKHHLDGIVYFADDDNVYSTDLFEQMRKIRRFGTWPVAMLTHSKNKVILEGPVCNKTQVTGWHTSERSKRFQRFNVDLSGFAFNSTILWDPKRWHKPTMESIRQLDSVKEDFQETKFIEQLVEDESQMEGLPDDCSKIMAWRLHLEAPELVYPQGPSRILYSQQVTSSRRYDGCPQRQLLVVS